MSKATHLTPTLGSLSLLAITACASDLQTENDGDTIEASAVITTSHPAGLMETVVDATDEATYRYIDLDSEAREVPASVEGWDLAFSRFQIQTNGGDNGDGGVIVARLAEEDFDTLTVAPAEGYVEDSNEPAAGSEGSDPNLAFLGDEPWYDYDGSNHQLSPADAVYVVRSTEGSFFKIQLLDYYDDAGTSGFPRFLWAELQEPADQVAVAPPNQAPPAASADNEPAMTGAEGCYDPTMHTCECEVDSATCEQNEGVWTPQCGCDDE